MTTFFTATLLFTGLSLLLAVPVIVAAYRRGRSQMIKRFLISGLAVGLFCGALEANSERLVNQCIAARLVDCVDYGAAGIQVLAVAGFGFTALLKAWLLRDE